MNVKCISVLIALVCVITAGSVQTAIGAQFDSTVNPNEKKSLPGYCITASLADLLDSQNGGGWLQCHLCFDEYSTVIRILFISKTRDFLWKVHLSISLNSDLICWHIRKNTSLKESSYLMPALISSSYHLDIQQDTIISASVTMYEIPFDFGSSSF